MENADKIVELYLSQQPTGANTYEAVKEVATLTELSPNYIRQVLIKQGKYVEKEKVSEKAETTKKSKRVSKDAAQEELRNAIEDANQEVDEDIIPKLTGKASMYFAELIRNITQ